MKMKTIACSAWLLLLSAPAVAQEEDRTSFTWWNDVPELIQRGNEQYQSQDFKVAEDFFRDAELKNPEEAVAAFNLGLAQAQQERYADAAASLSKSLNLAGTNAELRSDALYNLGLARLQEALKAETEEEDRERAIERALEALDSFKGALDINPESEEAKLGREQAKHFLQHFAMPPPPEQQQQQQQQQQESGEGEQGEPNEQEPSEPEEGEDEGEQEPADEGQQPEPKEGEGEEQQAEKEPSESESQGQGGQGTEERDVREMTQEEAEQLLNLLGDEEQVTLRKASSRRENPEKDW